MLPRDSQFSTTPFVFPLFPLYLSLELPSPFIPFATFQPSAPFVSPPPTHSPFIPWSSYAATLSPHAHLKANAAATSSFLRKRLTLSRGKTDGMGSNVVDRFRSPDFLLNRYEVVSRIDSRGEKRACKKGAVHGLDIAGTIEGGGEERVGRTRRGTRAS